MKSVRLRKMGFELIGDFTLHFPKLKERFVVFEDLKKETSKLMKLQCSSVNDVNNNDSNCECKNSSVEQQTTPDNTAVVSSLSLCKLRCFKLSDNPLTKDVIISA